MIRKVPRPAQVARWSDEKFASEYQELHRVVHAAGWKTLGDLPTFWLRVYSVLEVERLRRHHQLQLF